MHFLCTGLNKHRMDTEGEKQALKADWIKDMREKGKDSGLTVCSHRNHDLQNILC